MEDWQHDHTFGQDKRRPGESRTLVVIVITAITMLVEIVAGIKYGSMALLADGLHMASHTVALSVTAFAYAYARRNALNKRFSFGTGKVNALGGFTGAILLAIFALYMGIESVGRLLNPVEIVFNQAILVAVLGLVVNGVSVVILGVENHDHDHEHSTNHHDHNLKSAYLHVMADALTSVLAIVALLTAKYFGSVWMDPIMGIVGALLVARWSFGLLRSTSAILLDHQASDSILDRIKNEFEVEKNTEIADLHVWSIGPEIYAAQISIVTSNPNSPAAYKDKIPDDLGVVHCSIEVHERTETLEPNIAA